MLETYIRETTELVHLTINGGLIKTTFEHPFYVKDAGFVNAGELEAGNEVLDSSGNVLLVENRKVEITDEPTKVYNFQVDDFHTYHVGDNGVLVHNANYNKGASEVKNGVNIELKYKDGWTAAQRVEADAKVQALTEAPTVKTAPNRSGTSASSRYKKANGPDSVPQGKDVDHTIDLQLGGADDILNMNPLDNSVNRSLGKQIQNKIKDYPVGTQFDEFTIR
ncbi:hypothetical protein CLHUN_31780 [Ruminiclostridium hungatei]|uniref:Uncharacterized protein n=1 Tax=Ruminiclostridium hungatei TaxID=48256 RepID=A0A1V4SGD2_RUMHU|nr:hypothetical protein CLHUN_31780 [Ruminiclostridium hungatei]